MWKHPKELEELEVFKKNAKTVGVIMMIIGFLGAMFPVAASLTTVVFVAWMLLFSAFVVGWFTYKSDASDWRGWLKALIFFGVGVYMIVSPAGGIATLGLLFSIYFFMDAFSGFTLAASFYPNKGWGDLDDQCDPFVGHGSDLRDRLASDLHRTDRTACGLQPLL